MQRPELIDRLNKLNRLSNTADLIFLLTAENLEDDMNYLALGFIIMCKCKMYNVRYTVKYTCPNGNIKKIKRRDL